MHFADGVFNGVTYADLNGGDFSGFGTGSVTLSDQAGDEGLLFHNGSDLGDTFDSFTLPFTPSVGPVFEANTVFGTTLDFMSGLIVAPVPEPKLLSLLLIAGFVFVSRRTRAGKR